MALNFVVSYTFTPGTTISSSQVNTNESDIAGVFTGLEALTKSFSNLRVDTSPTATTDVAIKSYVDKLDNYRRPNLQYASSTAVNMETGINGTSGQAQILFPDGTLRTDSTAGRINLSISQVAALSGTAQSGLRTGTVANNTWYACYAVKVTDSTTNFVMVADVVLPLQANFATLNSNFGSNSWVYLGMIRYGDQSGTANAIVQFAQTGNFTLFLNNCTGSSNNSPGIRLATTAGATTLAYAGSFGTSGAVIPNHCLMTWNTASWNVGGVTQCYVRDGGASNPFISMIPAASVGVVVRFPYNWVTTAQSQIFLNNSAASSVGQDIFLCGIYDGVLGIGANPIL